MNLTWVVLVFSDGLADEANDQGFHPEAWQLERHVSRVVGPFEDHRDALRWLKGTSIQPKDLQITTIETP